MQGLSEKILQPWLSLEGITDCHGNLLRDAIEHSLETPGLLLHERLKVSKPYETSHSTSGCFHLIASCRMAQVTIALHVSMQVPGFLTNNPLSFLFVKISFLNLKACRRLQLCQSLQEKMQSLPNGTPKSSAQLSISLGPSQGVSPGPPTTLEIVPAGHGSCPHDNARACGVLRVLHGHMDGAHPRHGVFAQQGHKTFHKAMRFRLHEALKLMI